MTAVEWLETQFRKVNEYRETHTYIIDEYFQKEFEQAKQIEKEQEFETKAFWFGRGILAAMEGKIGELKPTKDGK